jgi:hypothetical protein
MKTRVVVLSALLGMSMSAAQAGPCTTEIDSLTKAMASKDAGQGPTPGAGTSTSAGRSAGQLPPTEAMSKQTQGMATSSQDVRLQNAGQPTVAQKAAKETPPTAAMKQQTQGQAAPSGGQPPTAAMSEKTQGQMPAPGAAMNTADASAALTRARQADAQGKEADCISAIGEAKRLSGQH